MNGPVAEQNRIESLDVTRGLAVLGILAVNAIYFAAPWQTALDPTLPPIAITGATAWTWALMHVLFEYKFITLFSLLFGASLVMVGGEGDDRARGAVLVRRLLWLLLFGLIHALAIWYGDILVVYALTGLIVMTARSWHPRALIVAGVALYLAALVLQHMLALVWDAVPPDQAGAIRAQMAAIFTPPPEELARVQAAYQGGFIAALQQNVSTWLSFMSNGLLSLMVRTAGVMLIGMALFKLGFLSGRAPAWLYLVSVMLGAGALGVIGWQASINYAARFEVMHMATVGLLPNAALSIFVAIAYASACILLVKVGVRLLTRPLAAVGRMAFSNYIAQSLIMTTLFWSGRGFGLYGEVDRIGLWAIVLAVWALQLIWSPLWLRRFEMGPLEWVWRRLSYAQPLPFSRNENAKGRMI